ncbi:polysaccharide deacetylase family protein [Dactylosporangium sp. CA-092794]|uniref:polysaccharide deacetylase family protein n=1 Tax=Dactylosporangium sp. CA-092794 TaxID=3239929 RepID=UPI003D913F46
MDRRALFRGGLLVTAGAAIGAAAATIPRVWPRNHLPFDGGYAPAADRVDDYDVQGRITATWHVETSEPVVAFTFDDGPGPKWTSEVLDALDHYQVPATFFLVGQNVAAHGDLLRGRLDRHEVGNHTWSHPDLATMDAPAVGKQLARAHDTIQAVTGRAPKLFRPPYGHIGGSTLMAADKAGYSLVLWSRKMNEDKYVQDPPGQAQDIVEHARPGQIILAHDVGPANRYVALSQLGAMFTGLRQRGFRFVTVSELIALGRPASDAG